MQLGVALGGALIGYATLGASLGAQLALGIGFTLGNLVYQAFLAPPVEGPRIKDPGQTDSAYGAPIPIVAGTAMIDRPTIIHCSELIHVTETVGGGLFGKGGGGGAEVDHVYKTFAFVVGVGQGGSLDLLELWEANKKILDLKPGATVVNSNIKYKWYDGTQETADPWLEELEGAGNVPAYRGKAILVIHRRELTKFGGVIPPYKMLVTSAPTTSYPWEYLEAPPTASYREYYFAGDWDRWAVYTVNFVGLTKRDAVTRQLLAYKEYPAEAFVPGQTTLDEGGLKVDLDGRVYFGTRGYTFRADPNTLTAVVQMAGGSVGSTAQFDLSGVYVAHWINYNPFVIRSRADGNVYIWNGLDGTLLQVLVEGADYTGDDAFCAINDADGYLWMAGGATLRKFTLPGVTGISVREQANFDLSAYIDGISLITFDPITNRLHLFSAAGLPGNDGQWAAFDIDTLSVVDGLTTGLRMFGLPESGNTIMRDSIVAITDGTRKTIFDTSTGIQTTLDFADYGYPHGTTSDESIWNPITQSVWTDYELTSSRGFVIYLPRLTGAGVTLRSVLEDTSDRCDFVSADYDFTAQTQTVRGHAFYGKTGAERIMQLRPGYQFDVISEDWQIKGRNRGGSSVATVDELELGVSDGGDFPDTLYIDHIQDEHLPKAVEWYYISAERDYQETSEPARRADAASSAEDKIEIHFPAVMTSDEAVNAAHRYLWSIWRNRDIYKATALPRHLRYSAADIITVTRGGVSHVMRLTPKVGIGANGIVQLDAVAEDPAIYAYDFTGAGSTGDNYTPAEVSYAPPTEIAVIDGPLLWTPDDGTLGFYVVAASRSSSGTWEGARIKKSLDGVTFSDAGTITAQQPFGFAVSVLGYAGLTPGNPSTMNSWDDTNWIDVSLINGMVPSNKTDAEIYAFAEVIAVGHPSRGWEIIQAGTKTLLGGSVYRYSHLLRGRFGSEQWADDHQIGDYVVHLFTADHSNARSIDVPAAELNVATFWKAESIGDTFPTADAQTASNIGTRLKPYAGYSAVRTDNSPGAGDLKVTWQTRSRLQGVIFNAPTGETSEVYRIDIYTTGDVFKRTVLSTDSPSGTYIKTTTANAPELIYLLADRTTDSLTGAASVKLHIYQISPTLTALKPAGSDIDLGYPYIVTV